MSIIIRKRKNILHLLSVRVFIVFKNLRYKKILYLSHVSIFIYLHRRPMYFHQCIQFIVCVLFILYVLQCICTRNYFLRINVIQSNKMPFVQPNISTETEKDTKIQIQEFTTV